MRIQTVLNYTVSMMSTSALVLFVSFPANSAIEQNAVQNAESNIEQIILQDLDIDEPIVFAFSSGATSQIVAPLRNSISACRAIAAEYRASCSAEAFRSAAKAATRSDYASARSELNNTARSLDQLVSQNADKSAPPLKVKGKTYRAVKKSAVAKVNNDAVKVIAETETKLLRSASSGDRKVHYQQIAQAVGSTKVIFRS